jgi:hypothetical protein
VLPAAAAVAAAATGAAPVTSGPAAATVSAEISDIDARLQALQQFLKAAKAGGPLPSVPAAAVVRS